MAKTGGTQWNFQDKNQRVSRVNSEFLRNPIPSTCARTDRSTFLAGGHAIIRNLSRKEKKISAVVGPRFAAIFSVALFALTFALPFMNASKESHVEGSQLVDLDGGCADCQHRACHHLARFDQRTLAKVSPTSS